MNNKNRMKNNCNFLKNIFNVPMWLSLFVCGLCIPAAKCAPRTSSQERPLELNATSEYVESIMRRSKAADMRNYMNESVDPCDNFYNFACGNWAKINPANSIEHITTGLFETLTKGFHRKVEKMLKQFDSLDTETDRKVKTFYKSCTNIKHQDYKLKLRDIIAEFGEMPVLVGNKWQESKFDWLDTIARIGYKYGASIIIGLDILPDYTNNKINRLYISQQDFLLESQAMYFEDFASIYRDSYRSKIENELINYLDIKRELAKKTAEELLNFEIDLARGMIDISQGVEVNDVSVLRTIEDMQSSYAPAVNISHLVKVELGESLTDEPVYEFGETYIPNLINVLSTTPKRIVANYIYYMLIGSFGQLPAKTEVEQEDQCISKTKKFFAKVLDNMIYRRDNANTIYTTERNIEFIWNEIKASFKSTLQSDKLRWIRPSTREYALQKLDAMKLDINSYMKDNLTAEFGELETYDDDYLQNVRNLLVLTTRQARGELHKPPKPIEAGELLSYTPANIILENRIRVPVSLLQPYYLWASIYPNAVKFGTIASLIGHELIHGFDDSGRKFDKDGNSYNWWDEQSTAAFQSRTECFANQYSHFIYNGRFLSKNSAQSENIADNGGVKLAYAAYLKWYDNAVRNGQSMEFETLPNINYTSKQLFFISYAQVWCNDAHPRIKDLQTYTDEHVPAKFRVIGPLSNFDEFSKEFNCVLGTRMNPFKKCAIY